MLVPDTDHRSPLPSLTGLRFVAAAPVFLFHISLTYIGMNPFSNPDWAHAFELVVSKAGWAGVSFFFVLSGFLLMWRRSDSRGYRAFTRKRLAKIVPLHLVTWVVAMALYAGIAAKSVWDYLPSLFLINSWIPRHDTYLAVNVPSWSLCSELMFYLLFPLIAPLVRRIRPDHLWGALLACVGATFVIAAITSMLPSTPTTDGMPISSIQFWFGYNFPLPRLLEFLAGMLLARLLAVRRVPTVRPSVAWVAVVVGYALATVVPFTFSFIPFMIVPLLLLIRASVDRDMAGRRSWLSTRTMEWLGEVSFGFYMVQHIVLITVRTTLQDNATYSAIPAISVIVGVFTLTLILGWTLYRFVEMPVMRRWSTKRPVQAPATVAVPPKTPAS